MNSHLVTAQSPWIRLHRALAGRWKFLLSLISRPREDIVYFSSNAPSSMLTDAKNHDRSIRDLGGFLIVTWLSHSPVRTSQTQYPLQPTVHEQPAEPFLNNKSSNASEKKIDRSTIAVAATSFTTRTVVNLNRRPTYRKPPLLSYHLPLIFLLYAPSSHIVTKKSHSIYHSATTSPIPPIHSRSPESTIPMPKTKHSSRNPTRKVRNPCATSSFSNAPTLLQSSHTPSSRILEFKRSDSHLQPQITDGESNVSGVSHYTVPAIGVR